MTRSLGGRQASPQAERAAPARPLTARLLERAPDHEWVAPLRDRRVALDVLRGLAVLFMVVDHLAVVSGHGDLLRLVPGRLALPLFFVIAGHVATRLTLRHGLILGVGLLLPAAVPWVDSPNVLVWYVLGVAVLVWLPRARWLILVGFVTVAANGYLPIMEGSYQPWALLALMVVGSLLRVEQLERVASVVPSVLWPVLAWVGRRALELYVAHLLLLEVVRLGVSL